MQIEFTLQKLAKAKPGTIAKVSYYRDRKHVRDFSFVTDGGDVNLPYDVARDICEAHRSGESMPVCGLIVEYSDGDQCREFHAYTPGRSLPAASIFPPDALGSFGIDFIPKFKQIPGA